MDFLYEDRLDGRIDVATYDKKAGEIREQLERVQQKIRLAEHTKLPAATEAIDLMTLTSRAAGLFLKQGGEAQRKLLHSVLQEASWQGGELRMLLRAPFENLRLSNSVSLTNVSGLEAGAPNFDNWRRGGDSNPR